MKTTIIIIFVGLILLLGGIFIFSSSDNLPEENTPPTTDAPAGAAARETTAKFQTKTDSQANVTVEVTPKNLDPQAEENIFAVSLNTHSVELAYDFAKIMILKDNLGNSYPARAWTGPSGWHHVSGDIIFPAIDSGAKTISLEITGLAGVDWSFSWDL